MTDSTFIAEVQKAVIDARFFAAIISVMGVLIGSLITYLIAKKNIKATAEVAEKQINASATLATESYTGSDFQRQLSEMFQENQNKLDSMSSFLKERMSKKLEYTLFMSQELYKINTDIFHKVADGYFEFQNTWFFNENTPQQKWDEVWINLNSLRGEIFKYEPFLSGNIQNLLNVVINSMSAMEEKQRSFKNKSLKDDTLYYTRAASKSLDLASKFIFDSFCKNFNVDNFTEPNHDTFQKFAEDNYDKSSKEAIEIPTQNL